MSSETDRFEVTIELKVTKNNKAFAATEQRYVNMDYTQMQVTQRTVLKALIAALVPLGDALADQEQIAQAESLLTSALNQSTSPPGILR
jgi:hypothetical protein